MPIEKGSLKDWDDRHYQSIDDLPPEAWDAVRDKRIADKNNDIKEMCRIMSEMAMRGHPWEHIARAMQDAGFKRD